MGPLLFTPYLRPMVWGGRRLGDILGKSLPDNQLYGEAWDVSDHASHSSVIAVGPLRGKSLHDLMSQHRRELLGAAADKYAVFPWLVKFLDCHDWLSVQVHPTDELAKKLWPGEGGKTEVWYILDVKPGSRIFAGLLPGVDEKALRAALSKGTVAECLHSFEPKVGECVFLRAGTVHAVGGGVLMAEIQQTSDATFRLFDWNRVDAQGKSRTLHIEQALECIDWKAGPVTPVQATGRNQILASCRYFELRYQKAATGFEIGGSGALQLVAVVDGQMTMHTNEGTYPLRIGQVWLLPAAMAAARCEIEAEVAYLTCALPG